mmetsp:Transcript_9583/g.13579  ORF Transcript_9583/g.13579 Transcript_9583/m.13579 type:complete len:531 (-) Transcript_9583:854-2446(-)
MSSSSGTGQQQDSTGTSTVAANNTSAANSNNNVADVLEERLIDAEYKIWKKNTPYLYDFVMTHSLEWPSLTCQWLPNPKETTIVASADGGSASKTMEHSLLLGTHTTGEQNYLMVASVHLPKQDAVLDYRSSSGGTTGGTGTAAANNATATATNATSSSALKHYDEDKKEVGGFGHSSSGNGSGTASVGKIEIKMKIRHDGEVNRARYMPQNHFMVASRGPNPELYIWDLSKHPSFPPDDTNDDGETSPQLILKGHDREGYGLAWSKLTQGRLVSGSEDQTLCLWDINGNSISSGNGRQEQHAISKFLGHTDVVEDVDWHHRDPNMIGSVGDDRQIMIWDSREKNAKKAVHCVTNAHEGDINCIAFNPVNEFVLATGSADKTVALWDMRNLKSRLQTLAGHTDQVYQLEWAPFNESILGSCGADRRVAVWDLSRIGTEQTPEDAEDGPPELLFMHGGHTSKVSDLSWNANDEWTISSVSEDNVLQIWNMAEEIYTPEEEDEDENEISSSGGAGAGGAANEDQLLGDDELE